MASVSVPGFDRVTVWLAAVAPILVLPKVSEVGLNDVAGIPRPVPLSDSTCGVPLALSVTLREPVRVPPSVGAKTTATMQCWPGVNTEPEQPSEEMGNSVVLVDTTPVKVRLAVPVLVTLKFCAALVVPTLCVANEAVLGLNAAAGPATTALPVRLMVCVPGVAESVSVILAMRFPVEPASGLNCTGM